MTYEQARGAFRQMLDPGCDPTTLGAFWLANRWKSNTPTELAGFIDEMRETQDQADPPEVAQFQSGVRPQLMDCKLVDCGASYNGKQTTALLGVAAGIIAASASVPTVVHASKRVPTKFGDSYTHVLDALGVATDIDQATSARMVDELGFGFYYQPSFHPRLFGLLDRRSQTGVRSFLNTIETLANPAGARVHLGSCYHLTFATRIIDAAAESRTLDFERIVIFQGLEGYDDVRPGRCKIVEYNRGELRDFDIEPEGLGLSFGREDLEVDHVAVDSARLTEEILSGQRRDKFREAALLNAGIRIWAGGRCDELPEAVDLAAGVLDDGEPAERLAALRNFR